MNAVRLLACAVGFGCGGFWTWFGLACGWEHGVLASLLHGLVPGGLILLATGVALRYPMAGGLLLLAIGVGFAFFFTPRPMIIGLVVLPPVLAGAAFLLLSQVRHSTVG